MKLLLLVTCLFASSNALALDIDTFLKSAPGEYYDKYSNVTLVIGHDSTSDVYTFDCKKCSKDARPLAFGRSQFQNAANGENSIIGFSTYDIDGTSYYYRIVVTVDQYSRKSITFSDGPLGQGFEPWVAHWFFGFNN